MRRALWLGKAAGLVLVLVLAACGGGDDGGNGDGAATAPPADTTPGRVAPTPRPPAPRLKLLPEGEPRDFEAPFSVGEFIRQSVRGQPTANRSGGQRATYRAGDRAVTLSVYHFERPEDALDAVRFALEGSTIDALLSDPYFSPTVAYGVARDRHGNHLAAWSQYGWYYLARVSGGPEDLAAFMEVFPY